MVRFLDPCTKSGVFLCEITSRLTDGLVSEIPDLHERVDHVRTKQVSGIGITHFTSLLARRSLYCSKHAPGDYSIATGFAGDDGNIWFERLEHRNTGTLCQYCGAPRAIFDRDEDLETHIYEFIHTDNVKARVAELFGDDMQFDVIVSNPPYQLNDGGGAGSSATPLYHRFIEQAKRLEPRYLLMIVPSKWFSGGKGLDDFRATMLSDRRIRSIVDYPNSRDAFDGVDVAGGVMYFLWNRDNPGTCIVETKASGESIVAERSLDEHNVFVRDNRVLSIVTKVQAHGDKPFSALVSARRPFGINSAHEGNTTGDFYLYASRGDGWISRGEVTKGTELIDKWKVLLSKTSSEHAGQTNKSGQKRVLSRIEVMPPGSVATESYLVVGPFTAKHEAAHAAEYLRTRFSRFLVSAILLTQNITRRSFAFVPSQDFSKSWVDEALYEKYGLTSGEIDFIESTIRPMVAGAN